MRIALITARGGSKGLPGKNIRPLLGVPLIGWSIKAALESPLVDACYVSSDDDDILGVSEKLGAGIVRRPEYLAQDNSSSEDVVDHFITYLQESGVEADEVLLLQPTSPLRTPEHIAGAVKVFEEQKADCVISVFEPKHSPAKAYQQDAGGRLKGLLSDSAPYAARQKLPKAFQPNGAIYLFKVTAFEYEKGIPKEKVYPFFMSEADSIDIDDLSDFEMAESVLRKRNETNI